MTREKYLYPALMPKQCARAGNRLRDVIINPNLQLLLCTEMLRTNATVVEELKIQLEAPDPQHLAVVKGDYLCVAVCI